MKGAKRRSKRRSGQRLSCKRCGVQRALTAAQPMVSRHLPASSVRSGACARRGDAARGMRRAAPHLAARRECEQLDHQL